MDANNINWINKKNLKGSLEQKCDIEHKSIITISSC